MQVDSTQQICNMIGSLISTWSQFNRKLEDSLSAVSHYTEPSSLHYLIRCSDSLLETTQQHYLSTPDFNSLCSWITDSRVPQEGSRTLVIQGGKGNEVMSSWLPGHIDWLLRYPHHSTKMKRFRITKSRLGWWFTYILCKLLLLDVRLPNELKS